MVANKGADLNLPTISAERRDRIKPVSPKSAKYSAILLLSMAVALILSAIVPLGEYRKFDFDKFNKVAIMVQAGTLKPDSNGVVLLPADLRSISFNSRVYVSQSKSGRMSVFVPSWIGRERLFSPFENNDNWVSGYLYETADCSDMDVGPRPMAPWSAKHSNEIQHYRFNRSKSIAKNWCEADYISY